MISDLSYLPPYGKVMMNFIVIIHLLFGSPVIPHYSRDDHISFNEYLISTD